MLIPDTSKRHNLRDHPEFSALLEKIALELQPDLPATQVTAYFDAGGHRHSFRLDPAHFSVIDAGQPVTGTWCLICQVNTRRQFAFYVECSD